MLEKIERELEALERENAHSLNDIDKDEFTNWMAHPVTKLFRDGMLEMYLAKLGDLAKSSVVTQKDIVEDATVKGEMQILESLIEWSPIDDEED